MTDENVSTTLPGERLRKQREQRGLTLAQVSSELHVDQRMLTALEADDYAAMGAPIFVKGHLRSYAKLLGMDPSELVAEYEAAQQPSAPTLVGHRPDGPRMDEHRSQAWVGWFGWIFLLLLGLLLAGWWYYQQEGGADFMISNLPEREATQDQDRLLSREPAQSRPVQREPDAAAGLQDDPATDVEGGPQGDEVAGDETGEPATTEPVIQAEADQARESAASPQQVSPPTTQPFAPAMGRGLVLEFNDESWVEIYDSEGRPILYDLLATGTRREINATGQLRVFLGNAAGVDVYVNGEEFNLERHRRSDDTARFTVNVPAARN